MVWTNVKAGISQCSLLGKLLFSIHINDLANKLSSNAKLFAENTSLFSVAHNVANFAAAPWMSFHLTLVLFSRGFFSRKIN